MPEIVEAEDENESKVATKTASSTSSGEETLKDEDTIAKSPKNEKRLSHSQVPQFRGQQLEPQAVPTISRTAESGSKSKEEKEEGKRSRPRGRNGKKPEPESASEDLSDETSDTLSSSPPRRHSRGHRRRDQVRVKRNTVIIIGKCYIISNQSSFSPTGKKASASRSRRPATAASSQPFS